MSSDLNPTKALIFRIVHRENVPWILDHGLHCKNSNTVDPHYLDIGNLELIGKRNYRTVECEPGGTLSDYIPFYFTPFSPMLYNIKTGYAGIRKRSNDEIVIMVSSLHHLQKHGVTFVFTDRHAYLVAAQFTSDLANLDWIDWRSLQRRDFKKDDADKFERYQAEALVHRHLPVDMLLGMVCHSANVAAGLEKRLGDRNMKLKIATLPKWYF